jgi:polyhydroxyalkanoate synthesis regulator phasin
MDMSAQIASVQARIRICEAQIDVLRTEVRDLAKQQEQLLYDKSMSQTNRSRFTGYIAFERSRLPLIGASQRVRMAQGYVTRLTELTSGQPRGGIEDAFLQVDRRIEEVLDKTDNLKRTKEREIERLRTEVYNLRARMHALY